MKAIVYNAPDSRLEKRMEALTLKAAFLLSRELYLAGSTGYEIFFKESMTDMPVTTKLSLLEIWNSDDAEKVELLQKAKLIFQNSGKIKYKKSNHLDFLRKMEK